MIGVATRALLLALAIVALQGPVFVDAKEPLEYKLAVVDAGGYVPEDHVTVARFRSLLGQLSARYVESPEEIADISVKAKQLLRDEGIAERILHMMEGLNQVVLHGLHNQRYAEYAALYVSLRTKGRSHLAAVSDLQSLLDAILGTD